MTDFTPPTPEEVAHSRDPEWLRQQADSFEAQAHAIAERLRKRADAIELGMKINAMSIDQRNIFKAKESFMNTKRGTHE